MRKLVFPTRGEFGYWRNVGELSPTTYVCGFCGARVASDTGWDAGEFRDGSGTIVSMIRICPGCRAPTTFTEYGVQVPAVAPGRDVANLPEDLSQLYEEARSSIAANAYTGAVLICRKMLVHIGVAQGADEGKSFVYYVDYLASEGYVPPGGKNWVDHIRNLGNEASHEIVLMSKDDATRLLIFTEMLLRFIYEFPGMVPRETRTTP